MNSCAMCMVFLADALGQRSKAALNRWLKKREQTGVADVGEDELTTFDNRWVLATFKSTRQSKS